MNKMMKLLPALFFLCLSQMTWANNDIPVTDKSFKIGNETAGLEMNNNQYLAYFVDIHFNDDESHLSMISKNEVNFIQIMNSNGELEFQLPIFSKKLTIDVNDFSQGSYDIYIMIRGEQDSVRSTFVKN